MAKFAEGSQAEADAIKKAEQDRAELIKVRKERAALEAKEKALSGNKVLRSQSIKKCKEEIALLNLKPYDLFSPEQLAVKRAKKATATPAKPTEPSK